MFKILTLKRYKHLKSAEEKEMWKTQAEKTQAHISDLRKTYRETEVQKAQYEAEAAKYKELYADELQKRLALAEHVDGIEQRVKDTEFNLNTTEAELKRTKASIPKEVRTAKVKTLQSVRAMLRFGVPKEGGTISYDLQDIIAALENDIAHYSKEGEEENAKA